ncbi:equilibrative nucleobase transporter 1-like isoform X1 [Mercenaria mercenaria]|uniref:equilibrative nucleobase transporter 1-like isoform X1 n=1 Tax=Mercenaria mercenaria TaxID=6596 RepID=UPI00234EB3B9|nr:equilibrative nucleobase transporter 1-like isoform X1 [Mercenaria mercenaria]
MHSYKIGKFDMKIPCEKQTLTLMWCILECLFFSGYLNGWLWMQQILTEDGYYIEPCNISVSSTLIENERVNNMLKQPFTMKHKGRTVKCVYKKVVKVVSVDEYARLENESAKREKDMNKGAPGNALDCSEQENKLEFVYVVVLIIRNIIMLPLGIFLDVYGSSRTRIIAMCCTAFGSLTMLFSSNAYPWLILPALLMLGVSGALILLTDLQVSNLFGSRRYTVMSVFVGAYFSGGIVIFFMKLTKATGVTLQTSFMFTTIGIVPVLISTIAMLPRSRIPWPLPAEYGKSRRMNHAEDKYAKAKAWQRRISVGNKKKNDLSEFWETIKTKMFIFCVIWFSLHSLKIWLFDMTVDIQIRNIGISDTEGYISLYAMILLLSLPMSPLIGIIMDWNKKQVTVQHHVLQMKNIFIAICVHLCIAILSSVTSLFSNVHLQVLSFILVAMEKVALHATLFAFLTHVHFPSEHFGKLVGTVISVSGGTLILQFPLKLLIHQGASDKTIYVHVILLVIVLLSGCHPLSLWYHCRTGSINNSAEIAEQESPLTVVLMESIMKKPDECDNNTPADGVDKMTDAEATKLQITDL